MPDPIFADARLAPLYDAFEPDRSDLDAYVALAAELGARHVVDLGCGTGVLAVRLAAGGLQVTGVDPAGASLDVARARPGGDGVRWLDGDASALAPGTGADLVVMTGNAAQAVLSDDDWAALLRHVHAALRPGGAFAFETRRPARRAWDDWAAMAPVTVDVPGTGRVERSQELLAVDLPLVSFRITHRFPDGTELVSDSTLRFRERAEVETGLHDAGFTVRDVREAPDRPGREFVFVAGR